MNKFLLLLLICSASSVFATVPDTLNLNLKKGEMYALDCIAHSNTKIDFEGIAEQDKTSLLIVKFR